MSDWGVAMGSLKTLRGAGVAVCPGDRPAGGHGARPPARR